MSTHEVLLELVVHNTDDVGAVNAGGVGGNDSIGLTMGSDLLENALLDVDALGNRFNDPVSVIDLVEVIGGVADTDVLDGALAEGHVVAGLLNSVKTCEGETVTEFVAVLGKTLCLFFVGEALRGNDVKQYCFNADACQKSGDRCTHDTCAENNGFVDVLNHEIASLLFAFY